MAQKKRTSSSKAASAKTKKADLTVVKGGTAVAETSKKSTAVATTKTTASAEAKDLAVKEEKTKATTKKPATKRTTAKKAVQKVEAHIFEIDGAQVSTEDVVASIKEAYKAEGHQIGRIKKIDVYYNFEERRAYYVINDNAEGKFVEF